MECDLRRLIPEGSAPSRESLCQSKWIVKGTPGWSRARTQWMLPANRIMTTCMQAQQGPLFHDGHALSEFGGLDRRPLTGGPLPMQSRSKSNASLMNCIPNYTPQPVIQKPRGIRSSMWPDIKVRFGQSLIPIIRIVSRAFYRSRRPSPP